MPRKWQRRRAHLLRLAGWLPPRLKSGQQWDAPNGWAPLQWVAAEGLQSIMGRMTWQWRSLALLTMCGTPTSREKLVEKLPTSTCRNRRWRRANIPFRTALAGPAA
ncbi:hypothetical protein KCP78_08015 [Salmonella enterica subsp. enterica]|nr:hypothetical protein KCP78_08015 [Salmonella enterica subsp. enterica]